MLKPVDYSDARYLKFSRVTERARGAFEIDRLTHQFPRFEFFVFDHL